MHMMGMKHSVPWVVWLVIPFVTMTFLSLTLTLLLKYGGLLPMSDGFLIFCSLFVYSLSLLGFRSEELGIEKKRPAIIIIQLSM